MEIIVVVFSALAVWAVVASVVVALRDGYRATPTCESEAERNRPGHRARSARA